jgi:S-adenosylmethionine-dependent methyltransferase
MNKVKEYYNTHAFFEDKRLDENEFEIPFTLRYIERYVKPGAKILDIACGTGNYAEKLLKKGYLLGLNDLSENNIKLTRQKIKDNSNVLHLSVSDALNADIWEKETWDAILLLGPLYHFTEKKNRLKVLEMAKKM